MILGCEILNGLVDVCDFGTSGVEQLWFANKADVASYAYNSSGLTTGITMVSGKTFFEFEATLDSITFTDPYVIGAKRNFAPAITFGVGVMTQSVLNTIETLSLANVVAILKIGDDYRLAGHKGTGLRVSANEETSGTASGNDGAISVTVSGVNRGKMSFIDPAVMTTLGLI